MGKIHKFYYDPKDRDKWMQLRTEVSGKKSDNFYRVGASDVAACAGYSKYKSPLNCFFEAIGMIDNRIESLRMSLGLVSEATNKLCYENFDQDEQIFAVRLKNKQKFNSVKNANFIAVNEDFPYIFASLDFVRPANNPALVDSPMFTTGEVIPFAYPIDSKNISYQNFAANGKKAPKNYTYQMLMQMASMGVDYSELSMKIEDSDYRIEPVVWDGWMVDVLMRKVEDFCQRVVAAKPLAKLWLQAKSEFKFDEMAIYEDLIGNLQPDVIGLDSEIEALEGLYLNPIDESIVPDDTCIHHYNRYVKARRAEALAKRAKLLAKSYFVNFMGNSKTIDLGDKKKIVHYRTDKDKFYFSVK